MENVLKKYLERCQIILNQYRSSRANLIVFPGTSTPGTDYQQFFEKAIKDAESTPEFEAFVAALQDGPLLVDLERLAKARAKARKESDPMEPDDVINLKRDTACYAAKGFFRNTGVYVDLWQDSNVDEKCLVGILQDYQRQESELIRLFVLDGFVLYDDKQRLDHIDLPIGVLKKYTKKELEDVLRVPQSIWHGNVDAKTIETAAAWHILTIRQKEEYRGVTGIWLDGLIITPDDWEDAEPWTSKESEIDIIGPIFLCIGEKANFALEIRLRTNIFEYFSIREVTKNQYLPWDSFNEEGEPAPRTAIERIGPLGNRLKAICEIWQEINGLDRQGHLRYPTQTLVRALTNLHASREWSMETFVSFVTVIESLLTPGSQQELAYRMATRGASLLELDPEKRMKIFNMLMHVYKIRSRIVHEGHVEDHDSHWLNRMGFEDVVELSRQIFLRYICVLHLALHEGFPGWVLPDSTKLLSRNSRSAVISRFWILVLAPHLTNELENSMKRSGVYKDWKRKTYTLSGSGQPA
jgi:hypothetical protein